MLRSKNMKLNTLYIPHEHAYSFISACGDFERMHFIDLQAHISPQEKTYYPQLRRLETIYSSLDEIEAIIKTFGLPISRCPNVEAFMKNSDIINKAKDSSTLNEIEKDINLKHKMLEDQQTTLFKIIEKRNSLFEKQELMMIGESFIQKDEQFSTRILGNYYGSERLYRPGEQPAQPQKKQYNDAYKLSCLAGSINAEEIEKFHRIMFRATKGNIMFRHQIIIPRDSVIYQQDEDEFDAKDFENGSKLQIKNSIIDPRTLRPLSKAVFFLFFQSGVNDQVRKKVLKICEVFNVALYEMPNHSEQLAKQKEEIASELSIISQVIKTTKNQILDCCLYFSQIHKPENYKIDVKEQNIICPINLQVIFHLMMFIIMDFVHILKK